ncbi:MAG: metallophosphoesterase [Syntrophales bacterium]|jgi:Icc-related predicted phosphoesterase|nr:metallophosphoesterase [Syntrophales bacterium]MDY0043440.1 metallophosphoesterase [Syntrophales bacterium]
MRIIYAADIHGAFERVKTLLSETVADLYIITGDLIDIPFYTMNTAINYHDLQVYFYGLRRQMEKEGVPIEDFVDELLERPDISDEAEEKGTRYQQYTIRARRVLQQKYKVLENILATKQTARILSLPGNYDMDLKYTSLYERDLHMRCHEIEGIKFAGYGGADIWTPGIPERYVVKYRAGKEADYNKNEMIDFFRTVHPDIVITHQPAHGIHDRVLQFGTSGSAALRHFCDTHPVTACLSGHIHADWGFDARERTIYLNPSNFGEVTLMTGGVSEGGFFYSIEIEHSAIEKIIFKKIVDNRIYDIADYYKKGEEWIEDIIDEKRYGALKKGKNFDMKVKKYSHIPEIQLYNEIKQFYRMFQTGETDERIDRMEQVAHLIEEKIQDDIAMDILGSTNMGICETGSDIDFALYIRCPEGITEMRAYRQYKKAARLLEEILRPDYAFQILDCIDLGLVEKSIREKNYECEATQRFVAYRSICRPINYRVIAPVEDLLNKDLEFRSEMEGSIQSYMKIFANTSRHTHSFEKYEYRIRAMGIKIPVTVRQAIMTYLNKNGDTDDT